MVFNFGWVECSRLQGAAAKPVGIKK